MKILSLVLLTGSAFGQSSTTKQVCDAQQANVNAAGAAIYQYFVAHSELPAGINGLSYQDLQNAATVEVALLLGMECNYLRQRDDIAALKTEVAQLQQQMAAAPPASPPTASVNLPAPTIYSVDDCGDLNILSTTPFTTGTNAKGYTLNSCSVYFSTVPANSTFSWAVYQRGANGPAALLASSTAPVAVTIPNAWAINSNAPPTVLQPNTTYDATFGKSPYGLCARENYEQAQTGYTTNGPTSTFIFQGTYPNPFPVAQASVPWSEYCTVTPVQ